MLTKKTSKYLLTFTFLFSFLAVDAKKSYLNQPSPPLEFKSILQGGNPEEAKGKYIVLDFWATWCTPCIGAMPHMNKLAEQYKDKLQVIFITDEDKDKVSNFLIKRKLNGWVALDNNGKTFKNFDVSAIPRVFIISPDQTVLFDGTNSGSFDETLDKIFSGTMKKEDQPKKETTALTKPKPRLGGFSGGDDPVVTANFDMHEMGYIRQEIFRKSVYDKPAGSGWSTKDNGVGISILGYNIASVIAFTDNLPSRLRVVNRSAVKNEALWDIIFLHLDGYNMAKGMAAVRQIALDDLSIGIKDTFINTKVWVPDLNSVPKLVHKKKEVDPALKSLTDIFKTLEERLNTIVLYKKGKEEAYLDMFELGNEYYHMTGEDLKAWLEKQGFVFKMEKKNVPMKCLYNKS